MAEFFEALVEFLKSDFAKENVVQIIVLQIGIVGITIFLTVLYFNIIHIPVKLRRSDYIVPKYEEAMKKIENLESENAKMKEEIRSWKRDKRMEKALNSDGVKEGKDTRLDKF